MIHFLDSPNQVNIGDVAFGILENNRLVYGVVRDIENNKAGFGYGTDINYTCAVCKSFPLSHCDFVPYKPKQPIQLSIF